MKIESTHFLDKKMLKADSNYTCLAKILIDFVIKKDENSYPQVFFIECKYIEKEKTIRHIADDLELCQFYVKLHAKIITSPRVMTPFNYKGFNRNSEVRNTTV